MKYNALIVSAKAGQTQKGIPKWTITVQDEQGRTFDRVSFDDPTQYIGKGSIQVMEFPPDEKNKYTAFYLPNHKKKEQPIVNPFNSQPTQQQSANNAQSLNIDAINIKLDKLNDEIKHMSSNMEILCSMVEKLLPNNKMPDVKVI